LPQKNSAYVARELNLSAGYFGDLIKKETGKTAQEHIQWKVIDVAKEQIFDQPSRSPKLPMIWGLNIPNTSSGYSNSRWERLPNEYRTSN
jgi:hypothetical protein